MSRLKQSYHQYRNINGKHFMFNTANTLMFEEVKRDCKERGLAYRMISGQLFTEVPTSNQLKKKTKINEFNTWLQENYTKASADVYIKNGSVNHYTKQQLLDIYYNKPQSDFTVVKSL